MVFKFITKNSKRKLTTEEEAHLTHEINQVWFDIDIHVKISIFRNVLIRLSSIPQKGTRTCWEIT